MPARHLRPGDGRRPLTVACLPAAGTGNHSALRPTRHVFDGTIAGLGTRSGVRIVVGHWPRSPFGAVADVMIELPDGHRQLIAPTAELARFIAGTYTFDEVIVAPVTVTAEPGGWTAVTAGPLRLRYRAGRRGPLGRLLRTVPAVVRVTTTVQVPVPID